jgi:hypothetical protein
MGINKTSDSEIIEFFCSSKSPKAQRLSVLLIVVFPAVAPGAVFLGHESTLSLENVMDAVGLSVFAV